MTLANRIAIERFAIALFSDYIFEARRNMTPQERKDQPLPIWPKAGSELRNAYRETAASLLLEQAQNKNLDLVLQDLS